MKDKRLLVIEDEQRAGEKLVDLLKEIAPNAEVAWLRSVAEGINYLAKQTPDLIFSDIELLDGNSFQIYESIKPKCPIIFCTAYDKFYVAAFNTNGIAYLLKPYTKEEVTTAWEKYKMLFDDNQKGESISSDLISELKVLVNNQKQYKRTFSVKKRDGVFLLKVEEVSYFQAQGDFVFGFDTSGKKHILNYTLSAIEGSIDPQVFFRINRSEIVNVECILKYSPYTKNRLTIDLSKPQVTLFTSNSRTPEFRSWIEGQ